MLEPLKKNPNWKGVGKGRQFLQIMDGVGYGAYKEGDAVLAADMEHFRELEASCPTTHLKAHGTAVGLPSDDDMGNFGSRSQMLQVVFYFCARCATCQYFD